MLHHSERKVRLALLNAKEHRLVVVESRMRARAKQCAARTLEHLGRNLILRVPLIKALACDFFGMATTMAGGATKRNRVTHSVWCAGNLISAVTGTCSVIISNIGILKMP